MLHKFTDANGVELHIHQKLDGTLVPANFRLDGEHHDSAFHFHPVGLSRHGAPPAVQVSSEIARMTHQLGFRSRPSPPSMIPSYIAPGHGDPERAAIERD